MLKILKELQRNKRLLFMDIDGVVADCTHRLKYINGKKKDYDKFYGLVNKDKPIQDPDFIKDMADAYNGKIVFLTGRRDSCIPETVKWLGEHYDMPEDYAICNRSDGDHRPAPTVKAGLALGYIHDKKIKACMVIDDMEENVQTVVDALSDAGIKRVMGCLVNKNGTLEG